MKLRHFLTLSDLTSDELRTLIRRASELKALHKRGELYRPLRARTLAMVFDKSSTRTRVSFEAGMAQLGGDSMFLSPRDLQLGRGEPIEDTSRVMSRMVDVIVIRTHEHATVTTFAQHSVVPVVNALTDRFHPCQLLADMQTYLEHRGDITGRTAVWIGDGNNVCHSWMNAARLLDFTLVVSTPAGYEPDAELVADCGRNVRLVSDPREAAKGAEVVVTDTWASMGQEGEKAERAAAFQGYRVDDKIMAQAAPDALFMHCLPAYRGSEVTAEVLDGAQSVVWDEAENRLHAQKALLEFLLVGTPG
ncbi:MAG: ornithine carbamoyltransferase [Acidiferrobacteraceae bacterium]